MAKKPKVKLAKPAIKQSTALTVIDHQASAYGKMLDQVEKDVGVSSEEMHNHRLSTGTLALDMVIGGGMRNGMMTLVGQEGSAKSTQLLTTLGYAVRKQVPVVEIGDAEGTIEPIFSGNILQVDKLENVFGKKIEGKWVVQPKIRYYDDNIIETTFDRIARTLNRIPDKIYRPDVDKWFLVVDPSDKKLLNFNNKTLGEPDSKLSDKGKLWFPTLNPYPQAVIGIDSYPLLLPEGVDENEESSKALAQQARAYSQQLPRVVGKLRRKHVLLIGTNQIRENPGARFQDPRYEPCFVRSTTVITKNGVDTIGDIVKKKKKVKVLSFDSITGKVSYKKIIDWKDNGLKKVDSLVKLTYEAYDSSGIKCFRDVTCTKNHKIWSNTGWKFAGDLKVGDTVYTSFTQANIKNNSVKQIILGSLLGDGRIFVKGCRVSIEYDHVRYQRPYMAWKGSLIDQESLDSLYTFKNGHNMRQLKLRGKNSHYTRPIFDPALASIARKLQYKKNKLNDKNYTGEKAKLAVNNALDMLDLSGLAIWYMDDGHFAADSKNGNGCFIACSRYSRENKEYACKRIIQLANLDKKDVIIDEVRSGGCIAITRHEAINKFLAAIMPYMHPSMAYKVYSPTGIGAFDWNKKTTKEGLHPSRITAINLSDLKSKYVNVYDLTVADNHTYFVGGEYAKRQPVGFHLRADALAVSNCGSALRYNSSVRNWFTPRAVPDEWKNKDSKISEEQSVEGRGVDQYAYKHISNKKCKWGTPFLESWMRVWVSDHNGEGRGIDPVFDCFIFLSGLGLATRTKKKNEGIAVQFAKGDHPFSGLTLNWLEFKTLILYEEYKTKDLRQKAEVVYKRYNVNKPYFIRKSCHELISSGKASKAMMDNRANIRDLKSLKAKSIDDDLEG